MSASLLNAATMPGSGAQPGASVGIAVQAAQAAQAKGPMAGFEALLAAFFGDQGLTVPTLAGLASPVQAQPGQAQPGQPQPGQAVAALPGVAAALTGKTNGKAATAGKSGATDADKAADATVAGATDAANAALALVVPVLPIAQPVPTAQTAGPAAAGDAAPDAGLSSKLAGSAVPAQFAVAIAAVDAKTAKAAGVLAQDTTKPAVAAATTPAVARPDAPAAPQGPAQPSPAPALSDQTPATTAAALPAPTLPAPTPLAPTPLVTPAVAPQAKAPEAPVVGKDKVQTAKAARVDGVRAEAPPVTLSGKAPLALQAAADGAGEDAAAEKHDPAAPAATEAKPAASDNAPPAGDFNLATNTTASANAAALAHAATLVRGSPQTVANLAAQIAKKLDGRSSRFDVQLDPAGLGKVDVRVEIDAAGKMTAAMNFDSQQAANELKSRAGELQRALEQAGFDMSGGMSFDVTGQGGRGQPQGQDADNGSADRGRAFEAVLNGTAEADAGHISYSRASRAGVDIRI